MRGGWGFFFEVVLPGGVVLAVSLALLYALWKRVYGRHSPAAPLNRSARGRQGIAVVLFVVWVLLMGSYVYHGVRFHYDLWRLKPGDVEMMRIGQREFRDPEAIAAVVNDLKSSDWYTVNHGGWGDVLPITLRMRSGDIWWLQAGYHFAQHGAVVSRTDVDPTSKRTFIANWGHVFSTSLPHTLESIGVPIPMCDTAHGRPCAPGQAKP